MSEASESGEARIPVGYIRRAHGIAGAVVIRPLTDTPNARYVPGAVLETDSELVPRVRIATVRPHKDGLLVSFEGVADRDTAEALRGTTLTIAARDRRRLDPGEFWDEDLVGLAARTVDGAPLGTVTGVVHGPAQDRLVVEAADGSPVEVPFVEAIVPEVDVASGHVVMDPPDGLF